MYGSKRNSKGCYVNAITTGNKRKPVRDREGEETKRKKEELVEVHLRQSRNPSGKGKMAMIEEPPMPHVEPVEEVLNIELFTKKVGFVTKI